MGAQFFSILIGAMIGSLLGAMLLRFATNVVCKFTPPFGEAYGACFVVSVVNLVMGRLAGPAIGGVGGKLSILPLLALICISFLAATLIYSRLITTPYARGIGLRNAGLVNLVLLAVLGLIGGAIYLVVAAAT